VGDKIEMNTKNIKTAILAVLLIANIFFVYNIMRIKITAENLPSEMIENAAAVLAKKGVAAEKSRIPTKKPVNFIYEGVYSETLHEDIVRDFSGAAEEAVKMYVPAGISYTAGDCRFIFSDDDYFYISINIGGEAPESFPAREDGDSKKTEKIIGDFLKKYHKQDAKLSFKIIGEEENYIIINQTAEGKPIDTHTAYVGIQNGETAYFSGRWYFGELTTAAKKMPLLDSVNILFKSIETDKNILAGERLKEMRVEYTRMTHGMEGFYLAPSWRLEFESGLALSYNMITGNKN